MAVPKRKTSKARRDKRRNNLWKLTAPTLVRCSDCGELMLMSVGGTACGECESENLEWFDENKQEWTIEELEEVGFILIEK